MEQRSRGGGKGCQGPHMGTGTSREMFLHHHRGAWVHGSIAADGFDPSAVWGLRHEVRSRIRDRAVMVDPAGLPGLWGGGARKRRDKRIEIKEPVKRNEDETMIRRYDDYECHDTNAMKYNNTHNHTRPYTNKRNRHSK